MTIRFPIPPVRSEVTQWFTRLSQREQALIAVALVLGVLALLFVAVWKPLTAARHTAVADIERYEGAIARVRAAGSNIVPPTEATDVPPATAITDAAASFGMTIRRLEPEGARTRIVLEDTDFAKLIKWLDQLQRDQALWVSEIELDRRPAPGVVTARVTLEN